MGFAKIAIFNSERHQYQQDDAASGWLKFHFNVLT